MGTEAEQKTTDELDHEEPVEETRDTEALEEGEPEVDENGEPKAETPEEEEDFDVVIEGETQPPKAEPPRKLTRRFGKLVKQREEANTRADGAEERARKAEEKAELLRLRLEQVQGVTKPQAAKLPDPNDFDGGIHDPEYLTGLNEYIKTTAIGAVQQTVSETDKQRAEKAAAQVREREMDKAIDAHYTRAADLKVKDYDAAEAKVVSVLGEDATRVLINVSDKSEMLVYYFYKNPSELDRFAGIAERDARRALMEIGTLQAKLKLKPKRQSDPPPDPDEELTGGAIPKKRRWGPEGATFE